jgi:radical SAM protein with 4Fe4S-binding SPASM domain
MSLWNYWIRLARMFLHYRRNSNLLPYPPVRLWIELTSNCNYRCIMCPNKDLSKEEKGFMDWELYKKILDEAQPFVFDINLAHRGESLLHPHLVQAIGYAKKKKIFTRLHTNGSLLSENLSQEIIQAGLDRISFSFDGFDKETYEKIRRGGNFDKTVANIVRFLEIKKEARSKKPITNIEVIDFDAQNKQEFPEAKDRFLIQFRDLPLDSFVLKEMHNWAGRIEKEKRGKKYSLCPFPWNALIIYWNGEVLPCTQDFFGEFIVGNVNRTSLTDIWNGEQMRFLRKKLSEGNIKELKTCSRCDRVWREGFLGVPKEYLWRFITKRMP